MNVFCWNLGFASGRWREEPGLHERAWYWMAAADPDLAFVQEVEPPSWAFERWDIEVLPHHFWASAVLARRGFGLASANLPLGGAIERAKSYHATAELALDDGAQLIVASVHASPHEAPRWGHKEYRRSAIARVGVGKPWWNDVAFAGYRALVAGRRFIVAGDWNTSRWLDAKQVPEPDGQEFFVRAAGAGWVEVSLDADGREGKTWYGSTNPRFCQLDHVFCDPETASTLRSFHIDPYPVEALGLSDHAPMVLDLDLAIALSEPAPTSEA